MIRNMITPWLKHCGESVFDPMVLPMIFVELERKRLLVAAATKGSSLHQRVLDMEKRSKRQGQKSAEKENQSSEVSTADSETIHMLLSMNNLKNGLEGLLEQLSAMRSHLGKPSDIILESKLEDHMMDNTCRVNIDLRLKEIMTELRSKVRGYDGLLGTLTLATQMVCAHSLKSPDMIVD